MQNLFSYPASILHTAPFRSHLMAILLHLCEAMLLVTNGSMCLLIRWSTTYVQTEILLIRLLEIL